MQQSRFFLQPILAILLGSLFGISWCPRGAGQDNKQPGQDSQRANQEAKLEIVANLLDGQTLSGSFIQADSSKCTLMVANAKREVPASEIGLLKMGAAYSQNQLPTEVVLLDGSKLYGSRLMGKANGWLLEDGVSDGVAIPGKSIRAARLVSLPAGLESDWQTAINEPSESDAVIVMRGSDALERISGIIIQVQEASVSFELDGDPIEIPLAKLAGLIWFQRPLERIKPTIEIVAANHSVWLAESFATDDGFLELKTQLNQSAKLPLASIVSLDYSTANIRWFSDLAVLEAVADPGVDFKGKVASLGRAMAPRFTLDATLFPAGENLSFNNVVAKEKDLFFPGPGKFVSRVPEGFQSFQSQVVRTDNGTHRTNLSIEVWQDDNRLFQQNLPFDTESIDVNVPVQAGKRIRLSVVCSSKLMVGTEVQWKQPRLKR